MQICFIVRQYWPEKLTMLPKIVYELSTRIKGDITIFSDEDCQHQGEYIFEKGNIILKYIKSKDIKKEINKNNYDMIHFFGSLLGMYDIIRENKNKDMIFNLYNKKAQMDDFKGIRLSDFIRERRTFKFINPLMSNLIPDNLIKSHFKKTNSIIITQGKRYEKFYSNLLNKEDAININTISDNNCERVKRIPHGINLKQFSSVSTEEADILKTNLGFSERDKIVLYFGHNYLTRGIDDIIYSMHDIQRIDKNIKLLLVLNNMPDSSSLNYISKLANQLDNRSYKIILQYVKRPELFYKIADCVVLPYRFVLEIPEYPFVVLESMASGKPVITTPIGSIPELIQNNYNGILTKNKNSLSYDILRFIDGDIKDSEIYKKLGENTKNSIKHFDWEIVTKNILDIYKCL